MLQAIGTWLAKVFLDWLLAILLREAKRLQEQALRDAERGKINEENAKRYAEAQSRADRISRAIDLLNRNRRN